MDSPITLIIRAPNQRVEDHTVECMLGWTVGKLKKHLRDVYPSQPDETQQRLIYSGKLLADEMTLKDIIRQNDEKSHHTVHLVCSPSSTNLESQNQPFQPQNPTIFSNSTPQPSVSNTGLRHRGQSTPVVSESEFVSTTAAPQSTFQSPPVMMGTEAMLTPEQYMLMMQSYYYQMAAAQYMQYYQTGAQPTSPMPATEEGTNQNQAQPAANPPPAAQNPNMVMNAQGGMVEDDEDEEFGHRDWLDYIYTFSRFLVLVGIVYFYSNFTRFLAVCAFFFLIYLYRYRDRQVRLQVQRRQQNQAQQEQQQQQQQQNVENQQEQNNEGVNTENSEENNTENTDEDRNQQNREEPPPGVLSVAWCFVSTFFTSLIPAPPEPVNVN